MSEHARAIVLIGFSGAGKSSVGRLLAARTGLPRYDTDEIIRARFGLSIADIFERLGEEAFRRAETEALAGIPLERAVVVTGGGVVLRHENAAMLRRLGTIVHLAADEETLFERVAHNSTRPLLRGADPRRTLSELLRARAPLYRELANIVIDTTSATHADVADLILQKVALEDDSVRSQKRTR